jgi:hypothetical protein
MIGGMPMPPPRRPPDSAEPMPKIPTSSSARMPAPDAQQRAGRQPPADAAGGAGRQQRAQLAAEDAADEAAQHGTPMKKNIASSSSCMPGAHLRASRARPARQALALDAADDLVDRQVQARRHSRRREMPAGSRCR